jgi:hypothetical protein
MKKRDMRAIVLQRVLTWQRVQRRSDDLATASLRGKEVVDPRGDVGAVVMNPLLDVD